MLQCVIFCSTIKTFISLGAVAMGPLQLMRILITVSLCAHLLLPFHIPRCFLFSARFSPIYFSFGMALVQSASFNLASQDVLQLVHATEISEQESSLICPNQFGNEQEVTSHGKIA